MVYNCLKVETKIKPRPQPKPIYQRNIYRNPYQTPIYGSQAPQNASPNQMKNFLTNFLNSNLQSPHSASSLAGQKAMMVANTSIRFMNEGKISESFKAMIIALQMGVPEPTNSEIKRILLEIVKGKPAINETRSTTSGKRCICGHYNIYTDKFCTKCGRSI